MGEKGVITIHQPEHLPWLGFFNKMAKADMLVILDSVPFRKNYFQNRNKIIGTNGVQWLGVPVSTKDHIAGTIAATPIADRSDPKWRVRYLRTVEAAYGKHPCFGEVYPRLKDIILEEEQYIADLNIRLIRMFADGFGITAKLIRAGGLSVKGRKSELILNICKTLGAKRYIAGPFGREYLDRAAFASEGIDVCFNDYTHPAYPQRRTEEFVSHMSALDLVMNVGYEDGYRIIMRDNEETSDEWGEERA